MSVENGNNVVVSSTLAMLFLSLSLSFSGVSLLPSFWLWVLSIFVVFHLLWTMKKKEEINSVIRVSWWGH